MTSWWPLIDQRYLVPNGTSDCFETCLAAILQHIGKPSSTRAILAVHSGDTEEQTGLAMCLRFGLTGCQIIPAGAIDTSQHLLIALIHDDTNANPDLHGAFNHYVVVYDATPGWVQCFNPWGARDIGYPRRQFEAAYQGGITVPHSNQRGGDAMADTAAMKIAHAFVELAYDSIGHRGPDDQGRAYWIDQADKAMDPAVASWDALRDVLVAMRPAGGEFATDMTRDLARESVSAAGDPSGLISALSVEVEKIKEALRAAGTAV